LQCGWKLRRAGIFLARWRSEPATSHMGRVRLALRQSHIISRGWGADARTEAGVPAAGLPARPRSRADRTRTAALRRSHSMWGGWRACCAPSHRAGAP
jgi:hypothetical protein